MKLFKTFLLLLVSQSILFSQSGWVQLSVPYNWYQGLSFVNTNTGFIGNGNLVLKTTNAGVNWIQVSAGSSINIYEFSFINSSTGWASCSYGTIIKTTNGGINWQTQITGYSFYLFDIQAMNESVGYVSISAGAFSGVGKTTNSGLNWSTVLTSPGGVRSVHFINENTGWACGIDRIYRTINGGQNWNYVMPYSNEDFMDISFINENTGWVIGFSQKLLKTTNGGISFDIINTFTSTPHKILVLNSSTLFVVTQGNGQVLKSINSGLNFVQQVSLPNVSLYNIVFTDSLTGYTCGTEGKVLKTTNGGVVGLNQNENGIPNDFSLSQNYPNPFNPMTNVKFQMPNAEFVKLIVYDALGREVTILVNEELKPGVYEVDFDGFNLPSGVYYYRLTTESFTQTKKMVLLK